MLYRLYWLRPIFEIKTLKKLMKFLTQFTSFIVTYCIDIPTQIIFFIKISIIDINEQTKSGFEN